MKRILHVIGRRPRGGIGTFLKNLVVSSDSTQIKHDFLINSNELEGEFDDFVKSKGSTVYVMPELSFKNLLEYKRKLKFFYKNNDLYDLVHIHSPNIVLFNLVCFEKKTNLVIHSHSSQLSDNFFKSIRNYFLNFPIKFLNATRIACGKKAGDFLFGKKKYVILYNGIDTNKYEFSEKKRKNVRKELELSDDKFIIGHVGNFFKVKNQKFLVDLAEEISKENNNIVFLLVGDGDEQENVMKQINEKKLNKYFRVLGRRLDIDELMSGMDVFVLPSLFEGFPLVCLEAQASGLNGIYSKSITTEIDLISGNIFLDLNIKEWKEQIVTLINSKKNVTEYCDLRLDENTKLCDFDSKKTAINLNEIYDSALEKNR